MQTQNVASPKNIVIIGSTTKEYFALLMARVLSNIGSKIYCIINNNNNSIHKTTKSIIFGLPMRLMLQYIKVWESIELDCMRITELQGIIQCDLTQFGTDASLYTIQSDLLIKSLLTNTPHNVTLLYIDHHSDITLLMFNDTLQVTIAQGVDKHVITSAILFILDKSFIIESDILRPYYRQTYVKVSDIYEFTGASIPSKTMQKTHLKQCSEIKYNELAIPLEVTSSTISDYYDSYGIDHAVHQLLDEPNNTTHITSTNLNGQIAIYNDSAQRVAQRKHKNLDYSITTAVIPTIHIEFSFDKQSIGIFTPLSFGSSGYIISSSRRDYDSAQSLSSNFDVRYQNCFTGAAMVERLVDIECIKKTTMIPIFCIGECKYGTVVHPLFRDHHIAHEIYCITHMIQESHSIYDDMERVQQQIDSYMSNLKRYSKEQFDQLKSSMIRRYLISNIIRNTSSMINQYLNLENDMYGLLYTLLGYDSEIYHKRPILKAYENFEPKESRHYEDKSDKHVAETDSIGSVTVNISKESISTKIPPKKKKKIH
jgi:hypothetical protein